MRSVDIRRLALGPYQVNTYIVSCRETGHAAVIDPAGDPDLIIAALKAGNAVLRKILNTHGHPDHVLANAALKAIFDVPVCMHAADSGYYEDSPEIEGLEKHTGLTVDTVADRLLADNVPVRLGASEIRVLHTPGHTPGSCCFLVDGHLFTGDTLFVGDVGRTDLKGGSLDQLVESIEAKLIDLPDDTHVMPGHDYGDQATSTIGREKKENPYITDFILDT